MKSTYEELFDSIMEGAFITDKDRRVLRWNRAAEKISGYRNGEMVGFHCWEGRLVHVDENGLALCHRGCPLASTMEDGKVRQTEVLLRHKHGHRVPAKLLTIARRDNENAICGAVQLFYDNSENTVMRERVKELEQLALHDSLTRLPNRNYILPALKNNIAEMQRHDLGLGIAMIDIDHFKIFNDTYGHDMGDQVLKMIANTLKRSARPFDMFGRWGGEEFLGIFRHVANSTELSAVAERVRRLVERSFLAHQAKALHATVSIGATIISPADTVDSCIKRADVALYRSKSNGRNRVTIHDLLYGAPVPVHENRTMAFQAATNEVFHG